jgi:hypothetical protein
MLNGRGYNISQLSCPICGRFCIVIRMGNPHSRSLQEKPEQEHRSMCCNSRIALLK